MEGARRGGKEPGGMVHQQVAPLGVVGSMPCPAPLRALPQCAHHSVAGGSSVVGAQTSLPRRSNSALASAGRRRVGEQGADHLGGFASAYGGFLPAVAGGEVWKAERCPVHPRTAEGGTTGAGGACEGDGVALGEGSQG